MSRGGDSILASVELAARIEHAEAEFIALAARSASALAGHETAAVPIAGGVATYAGPDSPFNKVAGLGFDGVPDDTQLDEIEAMYAGFGARVQVELSILGDAATCLRS